LSLEDIKNKPVLLDLICFLSTPTTHSVSYNWMDWWTARKRNQNTCTWQQCKEEMESFCFWDYQKSIFLQLLLLRAKYYICLRSEEKICNSI